MVPKNMTDYLQPFDLSVNKPAKTFMTKCYSMWYGEQVLKLEREKTLSHETLKDLIKSSVDLRNLRAIWINDLFKYFQFPAQRDIIIHGFDNAGISAGLVNEIEQDPFANL